jgi:hypothetical protein
MPVSVLGALTALTALTLSAVPPVGAVAAVRQNERPAYDSIPPTLPGNVSGVGFEALAVSEFGDQVGLATTGRRALRAMRVVMTSGACQTRDPQTLRCVTTPGATFPVPITGNIYAVDDSGTVPAPGALLATVTRTFDIPYRPSQDDVRCTGGQAGGWFDPASGRCFPAIALTIRFDFPAGVRLPDQVIWTLAFNTTNHGYDPVGVQPCNATPAGCGYDSLNAGVQTFPGQPSTGTVFDPNAAYINSTNATTYCDPGPLGVLRFTTSATDCFAGFLPLAEILVGANSARRPYRPGRRPVAHAVNGQRDDITLRYVQGAHHRSVHSGR